MYHVYEMSSGVMSRNHGVQLQSYEASRWQELVPNEFLSAI